MMNTKNIVIGLLIVLVVVFATLYYGAQSSLGRAGNGQVHYQAENFVQGLFAGITGQFRVNNSGKAINGGTVLNLTSDLTLTDSQLSSTSVITHYVGYGKANPTITLPSATNTPSLLTNGDALRFFIENRATSSIAISGALGGIRFMNASTTYGGASYTPFVPAGYSALIEVIRISSATTTWFFNYFR